MPFRFLYRIELDLIAPEDEPLTAFAVPGIPATSGILS